MRGLLNILCIFLLVVSIRVSAENSNDNISDKNNERIIAELKEKNAELVKLLESQKNDLNSALGAIIKYENQVQELVNANADLKRSIDKYKTEIESKKDIEQRLNSYAKLIETKNSENYILIENHKKIAVDNNKLIDENNSLRNELTQTLDKLKLKNIEVTTIIKEKYELLEIIEKLKKNKVITEQIIQQKKAIPEIDLDKILAEANSLVEKNDFFGAIEKFIAADKVSGDSDVLKYNIANLTYQISDFEKALEYINNAIAVNPNNIYNKVLKLQILIKSAQYQKAVKFVQSLSLTEKKNDSINKLINQLFK